MLDPKGIEFWIISNKTEESSSFGEARFTFVTWKPDMS